MRNYVFIFGIIHLVRTCAYQGLRNASFWKILRTYEVTDPFLDPQSQSEGLMNYSP